MVVTEEEGSILVAPTPMSSVTPVVPNNFMAWSVQGVVDITSIHGVCALLDVTTESNKEELLMEISVSEEGAGR